MIPEIDQNATDEPSDQTAERLSYLSTDVRRQAGKGRVLADSRLLATGNIRNR